MNTAIHQAHLQMTHPAAQWAESASFDALQIDCVTVAMLKILDNKCKMSAEEQMALMAIYHVVKHRRGVLLDDAIHEEIENARRCADPFKSERIHALRLQAEEVIPKPVMKHFKRYLRESLYGA